MFSYLENKNDFISLFESSESRNYGPKIIGPMSEGKTTYVESCGTSITYKHRGGYHYLFEENIVYKTDKYNLWPSLLTDQRDEPMQTINDLKLTKSSFLQQQNIEKPKRKWQARTIDMIDSDGRVRIFLPEVKEIGIAAVIFRNTITGTTTSPFFDKNTSYAPVSNTFPIGSHSIIVLYTDGRYLKIDSVSIKPNNQLLIDLNKADWQPADSVSAIWLRKYEWDPDSYYQNITSKRIPDRVYQFSSNETGNLTGLVYDENNDPIPGAVVLIKGTQTGAVTDINGHFVLQMDDYSATLSISFIGYVSQEVQVTRGSEIRIKLEAEVMMLQEVVVVGYGTRMKSDLTSSIGKVYGIASISGEIPFSSVPDESPIEVERSEAEKKLYQELLTLKTIRSDFSDVGFWEPRLFTDNHGMAHFTVTFPDDITRWDAVVYAMNRSLQTGTLYKSIRSYKPLMAELSVPRFLTYGDSANLSGKVVNYLKDTIINGQTKWSGAGSENIIEISFNHFYSDHLPVNITNTDSLTMSYIFTRDDGYTDGEERTIPVVEQGIIRAEGSLSVLKNGDSKTVKASEQQNVMVEIRDNQLDIYKEAASDLIHYRYLCNEQLASRLIAFINYKRIMQFENKPFHYERDINNIISRLLRNQNREFLWSWWDISERSSYWMSAHILRALKCAKDAGYKVDLNIENLARKAEYKFEFLNQYSLYDIDLLQSLAEWGATLNYGKYIQLLDSIIAINERQNKSGNYKVSLLTEKFILQEIRQMKGLNYCGDSIMKYKQQGMLGDMYFSDGKPARYWYEDEMSANVVAYRILKRDSLLRENIIPMQLYFMTSQKSGGWNTYQSSNLLMSVLPDLLSDGATKAKPATIKINGKENKTVTKFPYRIELMPGEEINIQKELGVPVFYMQYVKERVMEAKTGVEGFKIKTWFTDNKNILEAGTPVEIIVDVEVEKKSAAEHVMIEVPIPGACSYADKRPAESWVETHREYYKEKTVIFCENMEPGKYTFKIVLLPRFTGRYIVNPAQVSLMYFPVVNANTDMKKVVVE
jgi:hypothetical protein